MAKSTNTLWIIIAVVAAVGVLLLVLTGRKQEAPQGVVLEDVFKQTPPPSNAMNAVQSAVSSAAESLTDPVPSPAIVTSPQNGREEGFSVQVYSFQDRARADRALQQLKDAGYKAFMEVSDLGEKGTWYRVRIGELENEAAAKAMLDEVRKNYKSGFIVKPKV